MSRTFYRFKPFVVLQCCQIEVSPQHLDVVAIVDLQHDTACL